MVEVLSRLHVKYSMLKGLFGNEDGASRCYLVTIATEMFLMCDSVEGALNILRGNHNTSELAGIKGVTVTVKQTNQKL